MGVFLWGFLVGLLWVLLGCAFWVAYGLFVSYSVYSLFLAPAVGLPAGGVVYLVLGLLGITTPTALLPLRSRVIYLALGL